jgi:hypothetical protein
MAVEGTIAIISRGDWASGLGDWAFRQDPSRLHLVRMEGNQIARQRNEAVQAMEGDWILMVDSDCVPEVHAPWRLASLNLSVVGGVIYDRKFPNDACAVKSLEPFIRYRMAELPRSLGVIPVPALGTGCLWVRRYVFEKMKGPEYFKVGQLVSDLLTEDTQFCFDVAAAGFPVFLDCETRVGHNVRGTLYPGDEGEALIQWEGTHFMMPLRDMDL